MKKYNVTDKETGRAIMIENNNIMVTAPGGVFPTMKLSRNNCDVLRINKTNISTCNVEMLAFFLENVPTAFDLVFYHVKRICNNTPFTVSKALFYNQLTDDQFLALFDVASNDTKKEIISDHFCTDHTGKMAGIGSFSTSVKDNIFCLARRNNCAGCICDKCFAYTQLKRFQDQQTGSTKKLHRATILTTCRAWTAAAVPVINNKFFRLESFGDLMNVQQFKNYNLLARCNAGVNVTLWTKNPGIIQKAINDGVKLADNLVIGLSSLYINVQALDTARRYTFIRFLFTVYDDEYIQAHDIPINCGAKHCASCGICYKYLHEYKTGLMIINERLK